MKNRFLFISLVLLAALVCLVSCSDGVHLPEVSKVVLDKETASVRKTETISLSATVYPDELSYVPVTWSSADTSIATVNQNGVVTGVAGGQTVITATAGNKSASCVLNVEVPVTGIAFVKSAYYTAGVFPEQLEIVFSPSDATNRNVTWSTSDASKVTVSADGVVTAQEVGVTATITVTTEDGGYQADCTVESVTPINVIFAPNLAPGYAYTQWVPSGHAKALIPNRFERSGYYFDSWNTQANGGGTPYADGAEITTSVDPTYLFAQWKPNPVVTFHGNNETSGTMDPQVVPYNTATNLNANKYVRNGYIFTGWNTSFDGTGTPYADKQAVTLIEESLDLYAQWKIDAVNNPLTIKNTSGSSLTVTFSNGEYYATTIKYDIYNGDSYQGGGTIVLDGATHTRNVEVPTGYRIKIYANRSSLDRLNIDCDKSCIVFGNVMSLIYSENFKGRKDINFMSAFNSLFMNNTNIDIDPTVGELVLPATKLSEGCYYYMFAGCTSLTRAPEELPATTLAYSCYDNMFRDCVNLEHSPVLPATSLTSNSYYQMFLGCEKLKSITCLATYIGSYNCIEGWVDGVHAGTGDRIFYRNSAATCWHVGDNVPTGWVIQNYEP